VAQFFNKVFGFHITEIYLFFNIKIQKPYVVINMSLLKSQKGTAAVYLIVKLGI